jgi:hypothetical protein
MLFGETVAVYCENRTERTDTFCGQSTEYIEAGATYSNYIQPLIWSRNSPLLLDETVHYRVHRIWSTPSHSISVLLAKRWYRIVSFQVLQLKRIQYVISISHERQICHPHLLGDQ